MTDKSTSRSWFCVFNHPEDHGYAGEPQVVADKMVQVWMEAGENRACAVAFCVSADGLPHCHAVFESRMATRFSAVKKLFPAMHIEPTKGNKAQAEDYINKRGKWEEKGEKILHISRAGEIQGCQGKRSDIDAVAALIDEGKTPKEIMETFKYRRYERMIKGAFYDKRIRETPFHREVKVFWHVGESGSGKSYTAVKLVEALGEENIYMYTDYEGGGLDNYNGEPILFMDEFRGQIKYSVLLNMLQGYRCQIHARYANITPLWTEVHITSVLPPERVYQKMVSDDRDLDTQRQLFRRLSSVIYHFVSGGEYCEIEVPIEDYDGFEALRAMADPCFQNLGPLSAEDRLIQARMAPVGGSQEVIYGV